MRTLDDIQRALARAGIEFSARGKIKIGKARALVLETAAAR
jgi:hypothetical protein